MSSLGVVIIGRNEGERLIRCIQSLHAYSLFCVYVDSASTDGSLDSAKELGIHTLALDMSKPFTAARARNAGYEVLMKLFPHIEFVQFVDGDCEVINGWLQASVEFLQQNPKVAVVSGVLNERFPHKSIYNRLCDIEWKMPEGNVKACGGNALMRVSAFNASGGFLEKIIAGEEPELCVRLRAHGWKIWHINVPMMLHDADMTSFKQWWKRTTRAGYAYAEGASLHGAAPEYHWVAESKRALRWGLYIPMLVLFFLIVRPLLALLLALVYPLQMLRLIVKSPLPFKVASVQAFFLVIGKFAEMLGQLKFFYHRWQNKTVQLIEYK
jgi:GT2 family glycosyltransferase